MDGRIQKARDWGWERASGFLGWFSGGISGGRAGCKEGAGEGDRELKQRLPGGAGGGRVQKASELGLERAGGFSGGWASCKEEAGEDVGEFKARRGAAASWWCWWEVWLFGEFPAIQDIFPWRECRTKESVHSF